MNETKIPEDRWYAKSHEWVKDEQGQVTVGISDHAQSELTDVVFVDLPPVGKTVAAGATVLVLESVKTVSDIYAPVAGTVSEVNAELKTHPELVNQDPYGRGWIFKMKLPGAFASAGLLSASAYRSSIQSGGGSH